MGSFAARRDAIRIRVLLGSGRQAHESRGVIAEALLRHHGGEDFESFGYVVIVCPRAEQDCPKTYPMVQNRVFWPLQDPRETSDQDDSLESFRRIRDEIDRKIVEFVQSAKKDVV